MGVSEGITGSHRGRARVLIVLSLFLLSGGADSPLHPGAGDAAAVVDWVRSEPRVEPVSRDERARLEESLVEVNPSLSRRDRARISAAVVRFSGQYGLEPELVTAVMLVESDARPWARSPKGALGLMQVMPHMMRPMDLAGNAATIESNIEAGCNILSGNIRRLGIEKGISAYFWGSHIRGLTYLEKVLQARERVRGQRTS